MSEENTDEVKISKIVKRDGRIVDFDKNKIVEAIWKAVQAVGGKDKQLAHFLADEVVSLLQTQIKPGETPTVEQVQDLVERVLVKHGQYEISKAYILYRKEKTLIREEKKKILQKDVVDEVDKVFSLSAIQILASRYLLKNEEGKLIESPKQLFIRVAALIVIPDILHDPRIFDKRGEQKVNPEESFDSKEYEGKIGIGDIKWNRWHLERMKILYDELNKEGKMRVTWSQFFKMLQNKEFENYYQNFLNYYNIMVKKKFLPNSPTLFNAGTRLSQLSACFVLDVADDISSIMQTAKDAALIFQSGGGIGINWSRLRPEGDIVSSTGGVASGPISFMKIIDTITDVIKQGGKRRGACMGILEISHP
ncbi:MAG: ribonucleotide reductase N-terminal alpha domain-containing protein, partial [Candidatus Aenigmatarchaeota archaeon]